MPREYREERLARVLREQLHERIQGVQETVVVTNDGLVVAAYASADQGQNAHDDIDSSHWVGALAAEIMAQSRRAFSRLDQGAVGRILVEGESSSMIVIPAGDRAALAVMMASDAKLGLAMFQITRVAKHISTLLD